MFLIAWKRIRFFFTENFPSFRVLAIGMYPCTGSWKLEHINGPIQHRWHDFIHGVLINNWQLCVILFVCLLKTMSYFVWPTEKKNVSVWIVSNSVFRLHDFSPLNSICRILNFGIVSEMCFAEKWNDPDWFYIECNSVLLFYIINKLRIECQDAGLISAHKKQRRQSTA